MISTTKLKSPIYAKKETAFLTLSAHQTTGLSAGGHIQFDAVDWELALSSGRVTLKANTKYRLTAEINTYLVADTGYVFTKWYDVTNSSYIGNEGLSISITYAASNNDTGLNPVAVITPTTDIEVELRFTTLSGVNYVSTRTSAYIEAVEKIVPIKSSVSAAKVNSTVGQAIATSTSIKIQFNNKEYDEQNEFDNTTNFRFTAKEGGIYSVKTLLTFDTDTWNDWTSMSIYLSKNGANVWYVAAEKIYYFGGDSFFTSLNGSIDVKLNKWDYIELYVWHNDWVSHNLYTSSNHTHLSIHKVG